MIAAVRRYGMLMAGAVGSGLLCATAAGAMASPRGIPGPTILQAQSPVKALLAVVGVLAASTVIAIAVGRLVNAVVGLFVLGAGLFALAMCVDGVEELAFSDGSLVLVAVESLLWAALLLAACYAVFRVAGPLTDVEPPPGGKPISPWGPHAMTAAAAGVLVLPAVWIVAKSPMKGQVIGAVFVGGLLAGLVGRLLRPHVQPALLFVAPLVFGAIGHAVAAGMTSAPLDQAFVQGTLSPLALPMPVDYAAGSLLGVAVGLGWAKSFLHHEEEPAPAASA